MHTGSEFVLAIINMQLITEENCERSRSDNERMQRDYGKGLSELI